MKQNGIYNKKRILNFRRNENGQAIVEFALLLPLLLLLVLGMIEFGWLLNAKITLNSAAREGVRTAIVLNVSEDERRQRVFDVITNTIDGSGLTVNLADVTVTPAPDNSSVLSINDLIVSVKGTIKPIIGLFVQEDVPMSTEARMRKE